MGAILHLLVAIGRTALDALVGLGRLLRHLAWIAVSAGRALPGLPASQLRTGMAAYGLAAFPLIGVALLCVGMVMGLHIASEFGRFGVTSLTARVVAVSVVRELGPVFAALLLAGKAGAGLAAELGALRESGQLTAMRGLGVDLDRELLAPRIFAVVLSAAVLTVYADVIGVLAGMAVSTGATGVSPAAYLAKAVDALKPSDLVLSGTKSLVFGTIVGLLGAYFGLREKAGPGAVGRDTMRAVVWSSFLVIFFDLTVTRLLMGGAP